MLKNEENLEQFLKNRSFSQNGVFDADILNSFYTLAAKSFNYKYRNNDKNLTSKGWHCVQFTTIVYNIAHFLGKFSQNKKSIPFSNSRFSRKHGIMPINEKEAKGKKIHPKKLLDGNETSYIKLLPFQFDCQMLSIKNMLEFCIKSDMFIEASTEKQEKQGLRRSKRQTKPVKRYR